MGTLYIVSTPIGNLDDITLRAIKTLLSVDTILCEDTRHTGILLHHLKETHKTAFNPNLIVFNEYTEAKELPKILSLLSAGKSVALVSDAGTPLLSDPGYPLVRECIKREIPVVPIPGASSILAALVASGLPPYPLLFLGYPPEKQAKRQAVFKSVKGIHTTVVFFLSVHKAVEQLEDMQTVYGDIPIVIARELTKIHEEFIREKISKIIQKFQDQQPKGEMVVLFSLEKAR